MMPVELRNQFLAWQCRIRQIAMREDEGQPSKGMRARITDINGDEISSGVVVLIIRKSPQESTEFFKFQMQKHNDPQDVYKKGLTYLQSTHYHSASKFSDEMTALFPSGSNLASLLVSHDKCVLEFEQFSQTFSITCAARYLEADNPHREATLWHNRLFNRNIPDDVDVIGFKPEWETNSR